MQAKHATKPNDLKHDHMTHEANDQNEPKQSQIMLRQAPKTT